MNTGIIFIVAAAAVLFSSSVSAGIPNWLGAFNVDDSCNQMECCCVAEQVTITKVSDTQLQIAASVAGLPCYPQLNGSTTVTVSLPIPQDKNGFQLTTNFLGTLNRFTLNNDSDYIANVNLQHPVCSGMARRATSNWLGTYTIDDSCDQNECCCLAGNATITKLSDTQLLVSSNVAGLPCQSQLNSTSIQVPLPIPQEKNGFQLTTLFLGTQNRFTLTYDNQYIANTNLQYPKCSGSGRRSSM